MGVEPQMAQILLKRSIRPAREGLLASPAHRALMFGVVVPASAAGRRKTAQLTEHETDVAEAIEYAIEGHAQEGERVLHQKPEASHENRVVQMQGLPRG